MTRVLAGTRARRVPPGPPRSATPWLLRDLVTDRLGLMSRAANGYGDAVRMTIGPKTLYLFNHPDSAQHVLADNSDNYRKGIGLIQAKRAIGDGLLTSEGELWKTQRDLVRPAFGRKRIGEQAGVVATEAGRLAERLRAHVGGGPVDVVQEMTALTLGVLGRALFDADLDEFDGIGHHFEAVQDQAMFEMVTLSLVPMWVPLPQQLRFRRARRELGRIVDTLVAARERAGLTGDDVLSRLIVSARAEADPAVGRRRIHDELITLLLAGHETTTSTLSWTLYLVDRHPEVARRLHDEAVAVLGDRPPEFADLKALTYTTMVVQEAVRLYPPVWILPRQALDDDEVAGYHVPAGSDVLICPYTMHRHPDLWEGPDDFDPERFGPDTAAGRTRNSYIPFGGGPRFCVGNNLGMLEAVFVIATLMREFRLRRTPGPPAVAEPMLSLRMRGGLPMTVHPIR